MIILLADDNSEVRSALRLLLEQEPIPATVIDVEDIQGLRMHLTGDCPMILLLDWELPGLQCSSLLSLVRSRCPGMKVIALSSRYEARREAMTARVDAFVSKSEPPERILSTICGFLPERTDD